MKRIVALLTVLVMMLAIVPAMADTVTGTGAAAGFGGQVTVTVTLTDGVITAMTAEGADETPGIGTPALESVPAAMVAGNTVNVDAMSGATYTSKGVIEAAKLALTNAGVNPDDYMTAAAANTVAEDAEYTTDVVIVGAGGAGMTAALTASEYGAKVIIVESQAVVGGNSVRATGGMNAGDTPPRIPTFSAKPPVWKRCSRTLKPTPTSPPSPS